jgi:hypothetical protein
VLCSRNSSSGRVKGLLHIKSVVNGSDLEGLPIGQGVLDLVAYQAELEIYKGLDRDSRISDPEGSEPPCEAELLRTLNVQM